MRRNIILDVVLSDCQRLTDPANLRHLGNLLAQHGFQMAVYPIPGGEGVVLKGTEIGDYLVQTWPKEVQERSPVWGDMPIPYGRTLLAIGMEELQWSLSLGFKAGHMRAMIGGLVDFEFRDQRAWVEPFARRLLELAQSLYPELQSAITVICETGTAPSFEDVLQRKLKHINWVNIFGPPYVEKYGRDFLLGLPGYRTEAWADGSIYHQLSPTFLTDDPKAARALRQQVVDYCAQHGLKVVCKAPYHLAGVSLTPPPATEEEPIPDESVRVYMQEILRTTLLLKDGTRVKPVPVPWEALTSAQRQIALDAIKAAAIAEIRQHRDKRIRFEFNAIPDELDELLADLAGRDNPGFEWVEVDMEESQAAQNNAKPGQRLNKPVALRS